MHISIIEDEVLLGEKMCTKLSDQGYLVSIYTSYYQFMHTGNSHSHLYVVDIGLGDGSGFDIINWLRKNQNSSVPIIITSGYGERDKIIYGLNLGADDYMVKPCIPDEFLARVNALARRSAMNTSNLEASKSFVYKNIIFYPHIQKIFCSGEQIFLSKREMIIFELFIRNPHSIISRETIIEHAWSTYESVEISDTVINTAISRVRKKIGSEFDLKSLYNYGYILE